MRDLDQYSVEQDAHEAAQEEMDDLVLETDPIDIYSVIGIIADMRGEFLPEAFDTRWARDLLQYTQSNPEKSDTIVRRMHELDKFLNSH